MTKLGKEYEMKKTIKKNKALNEKIAHKGNLKNSTRIDDEKRKNSTTGICVKTMCDFKNLFGTR